MDFRVSSSGHDTPSISCVAVILESACQGSPGWFTESLFERCASCFGRCWLFVVLRDECTLDGMSHECYTHRFAI